MRTAKGMGRVYRRAGTSSWWIQFSHHGKKHRESAKSENRAEAVRLLRRRLEEAGKGRPASEARKVLLKDLHDLVSQDYQLNARKSGRRLASSWKRLEGFFGKEEKAVDVNPVRLAAYVRHRTEQGAKPGTVKLELAAMKRAYSLARKSGVLLANECPSDWPTIRGGAPRQGFLEEPEFEAVAANLPPDEADLVRFLLATGWRVGEALALTWRNVDRKAQVIRIETSKSGDPRTLPYATSPAISSIIERRRELSDATQKARGLIVSRVFSRDGEPIRFLRRSWISACIAAGLGRIEKNEQGKIVRKVALRLIHDLRRTFARNASRKGVSESVTMQLAGWRTASVFRRYRIVNESDLADGLAKMAAPRTPATGGSGGIVTPMTAAR